jgi:hypothetical protein
MIKILVGKKQLSLLIEGLDWFLNEQSYRHGDCKQVENLKKKLEVLQHHG